jgi:hypothetical protein
MPWDGTIGPGWVAQLGPARPLHAAADAGLDLPAHVRAGSGLRRWGRHLAVVQDDVSAVALIADDPAAHGGTPAVHLPLPAGPGGRRRFSAAEGNKAHKLDLEACVVLPDGRLLALGSGSTPARERLALLRPGEPPVLVDGAALYAGLRARRELCGPAVNIEGAVIVGDQLRLFQRGNGAPVDGEAPAHAVGDLPLAGLLNFLDAGGPPPALGRVLRVALGAVRGVAFGFTDAVALPDGRVLFLAGAEDSPDTVADGAVLGARVGLLDGDAVTLADILGPDGQPTPLKLEGVELAGPPTAAGIVAWVVADQDDPAVPTLLARLRWGPPGG